MASLKVFVGSSSEASGVDREVRKIVECAGSIAQHWQKEFKAGSYSLDSLLIALDQSDAAILILSPDDDTVVRERRTKSPRDNVVFELGMFLSRLGREKTLAIVVGGAKIPTDYAGVVYVRYENGKSAALEQEIRDWLSQVEAQVSKVHPALGHLSKKIQSTLSDIPFQWRDHFDKYLIDPLIHEIDNAYEGRVFLRTGDYYRTLIEEMESAGIESEVLAVSYFDPKYWEEDIDQLKYLHTNISASKRGVIIRRIFVSHYEEWSDLHKTIEKQISAGIRARLVRPEAIAEVRDFSDMVIFRSTDPFDLRGYLAERTFSDAPRVRCGYLWFSRQKLESKCKVFERVWRIGIDAADFFENRIVADSVDDWIKKYGGKVKRGELNRDVISCRDAAAAKGIPLKNELKTLIMNASGQLIAVQIPGNKTLPLRELINVLDDSNVSMASIEQLASIGLSPGTISALKKPVIDMPQIISTDLFDLDYVSTNDGTLRGFIKFNPRLLLTAKKKIIVDLKESSFPHVSY